MTKKKKATKKRKVKPDNVLAIKGSFLDVIKLAMRPKKSNNTKTNKQSQEYPKFLFDFLGR